jgi:phage tail sheath protein FI
MAFQVSPGINVSEIDLTTTVPSLATTTGAIGGVFSWGPIGKFILVDSENTLAARYGKPTNNNYETFFTAANFLAYGNALYVSRAAVTTGFSNTVAAGDANLTSNTTVSTILVPTAGNPGGVTVGDIVYSATFPAGVTVSTIANANSTGGAANSSVNTHTLYTLNKVIKDASGNPDSTDTHVNFIANTIATSAVANSTAVALGNKIVKNADDFDNKGASNAVFTGTEFVARYPGELGNSLKVSTCGSAEQYSRAINLLSKTSVSDANGTGFAANTADANTGTLSLLTSAVISVNVNSAVANVVLTWPAAAGTNAANTANGTSLTYAETKNAANTILQQLSVGDYIELGNSTVGTQVLKIKSLPSITYDDTTSIAYFPITFEDTWNRASAFSSNTITRKWEFYNTVSAAPGTSAELAAIGSSAVDQVSVVVVDEDGKFSGTPGTVLEVYQNLSRATDAKNDDGTTNFYKTIINDNSNYVWATADQSGAATTTADAITNATSRTPYTESFNGGRDGVTESSVTVAALGPAYDLFADASTVDVSLVMAGKATGGTNGEQLANYLVDNIAEVRKDCVVFVSPDKADVVGAGVEGNQATNIVTFRNSFRNTSYAVIDSGYKYQYDKYNDVYRYVPLNGDMAGLTARTDDVRDPWFSPAGFARGQIKNLVKLAYNPSKADRDVLYKKDINPVVTFPGQGTVLYGDKTALGRSSAFDRINVRRLFIVLEKTIANASNSTLFEFNDEFTRAQFRNLVKPFLRDVQGRRGIYDFRVVCDETNNTAEVVDSNRFVGDIYIKPAKSINFIQLNFVAVRSGVEFTEVVGQF